MPVLLSEQLPLELVFSPHCVDFCSRAGQEQIESVDSNALGVLIVSYAINLLMRHVLCAPSGVETELSCINITARNSVKCYHARNPRLVIKLADMSRAQTH